MGMTAIIPARGGSKGIPNKNIYKLKGHPLIAYSIVACEMSDNIDRIIVSTDSEEIAEVALKYGAEVPFMRPVEYATDLAKDFEYLAHFFGAIDVNEVALIRPTTPLRQPHIIDEAIEVYWNKIDTLTGLRSVEQNNQPVHKMFQILDGNYLMGFFEDFKGTKNYTDLPRQMLPETYNPNGYIDIVKRKTVQNGSVFGDKVYAWHTDSTIDVDSIVDLDFLEYTTSKGHILLNCLNKWI